MSAEASRQADSWVTERFAQRPPIASGRTFVWVGVVAGSAAVLWLLGRGPLRGPGIFHPADWARWARLHGAVMAVFVALRGFALAAAAYAMAITLLGLMARSTRRRLPRRLFALVALPGLRRFLEGTLSLGLTAAVIAGPVISSASASPRPSPAPASAVSGWPNHPVRPGRMVRPGRSGPAPPVLRLVGPREPAGHPPVLRRLDKGRPDSDRGRSARGNRQSSPAPRAGLTPPQRPYVVPRDAFITPDPTTVDAAPRPAGRARTPTWVLRPGDSLWQVAETTVARAWGRTPPEEIVGHYWWAVVTVNRPHLADPANPDLVFPGDVITLPPPPEP